MALTLAFYQMITSIPCWLQLVVDHLSETCRWTAGSAGLAGQSSTDRPEGLIEARSCSKDTALVPVLAMLVQVRCSFGCYYDSLCARGPKDRLGCQIPVPGTIA